MLKGRSLDSELIKKRKSEITERFGAWTAHNIQLAGDIYTVDKKVFWCASKLRRITQIVFDNLKRSLPDARVLDLACLEGLYGIELARHGAEVVAIEGRTANIEKANFAKEVLKLDDFEVFHDDVRNLSKEKYGAFDVVLCIGILYHLDVPDSLHFLENIFEVCQGFAIIDTHVSLTTEEYYLWRGEKYWGSIYREHSHTSTEEERADALWASLDNPTSFWFTRPSLLNLLERVGFSSVYECLNPTIARQYHGYDRITLLAVKGRRTPLHSLPMVNVHEHEKWVERSQCANLVIKLGRSLPTEIKAVVKKLIG